MKENFWEDKLESGYYDKLLLNGKSRNRGIQAAWHDITFNTVSKLIKEDDIHLDFACGPGTFIGNYVKGKSSLGVDISLNQIQYANKKYEGKFLKLDDFDFKKYDNYFDKITILGLIEFLSLEEIDDLIKKMRSMLKKNGEIIITTPNFVGLMNILAFLSSYLGPVNYLNQWKTKFNKNKFLRSIDIQVEEINIKKHLNLGIIISYFNLDFGRKLSELISKISKYNLGWILLIKIKK